jgi:hypothetical protein
MRMLWHSLSDTDSSPFDVCFNSLYIWPAKLCFLDIKNTFERKREASGGKPSLEANTKFKNDMPHWGSWQEISIEVGSVSLLIHRF